MNKPSAEPKRLNVLVLDGGGVRGLSSLLILQALMYQVNQRLRQEFGELHPQDVFQLVAGTSTGGLIALMLGKMGMTVAECITQYEQLSKHVFGKKHFRGRITRGLAPAKYSGKRLQKCVQSLLRDQKFKENMSMKHEADKVACAVICREHSSCSQYSKLKNTAVPICSLPCKTYFDCTVCEAARATSAAPTFFPVMKIGDRFFADGGLKHNNPSFAMYFHYTGNERKKSTKRASTLATQQKTSAPAYSTHGDLDCSRVRFTNIGTGAKAEEVEPGKREWLAALIPGPIRKGVFLKQTLTEIAVDSEEKADIMRQFEELNPHTFMYERFDANHGVSNIKLDNYNALGDLKTKTELYLDEQGTIDMLEQVAGGIATDYRSNHPTPPSLHPPASMPAASSSSSLPSSNNNYPESISQEGLPYHNGLQHGEPIQLHEQEVETILPPNGHNDHKGFTPENGAINTMEPGLSPIRAAA